MPLMFVIDVFFFVSETAFFQSERYSGEGSDRRENGGQSGGGGAARGQTLQGSFSAVSKPNFVRKYSLESS